MFDLLRERVEGTKVLDLYAGTGALAIEALSRGARTADLVDRDREAQALIKDNLERTQLSATLHKATVERALSSLPADYDLILADPPYAELTIIALMPEMAGHLNPNGLLVLEHASRLAVPDDAPGLALWKRRRYGDTTLSLYQKT